MKLHYLLAGFALCAATSLAFGGEPKQPGLFFEHPPFIHPKIIEDLSTGVSDTGEQVVAINLVESTGSNRYFGKIESSGEERPFVYYEDKDVCNGESACPMGPPFFGYRLVGVTLSGVNVLFTESSGGGSGRFRSLLLVTIEHGKGLTNYSKGIQVLRLDRGRWLVKRIGEIMLGDRYEGDISVKGNSIYIGKDAYTHSAGFFPNAAVVGIE